MPFGLDDLAWEGAIRGLARGAYSLLLGAGASRDGADAFGDPPPLGRELANDLIDEFQIPSGHDALDLKRAYEAAVRREPGRNYQSVDAFLHERFIGCTSPDWFARLVAIRWRRIYTLNIDDTLDHAYVSGRDLRAQSHRVTHWSHPYFDVESLEQVAIVHLHGRARLLGEGNSNNLVFGLDQYFDATSRQHSWHRIFADTFESQPFLVVGATLNEEFDLAGILRRGNASSHFSGLPSLVVLPSMDPILREELQAFGLVPIESGGREVFERIAADLPRVAATLSVPGDGRPARQAVRFLSQFHRLEAHVVEERDQYHDLYAGHDPTWQDIVRERDAVFGEAETAVSLVAEALNHERTERIFCLHGGSFTGKSTALLRAARGAIAAGCEVFLFSGDERIDVEALAWWLERSGPTLLVVDGLADFGADLAAIAEDIDLDEVRLAILGAERDARLDGLKARLPAQRVCAGEELALNGLSDEDINALIAKLRDAGRLGRITQRNRGGQFVYFRREHDRQLFPAMAGLERASGFTDRLRDLWRSLGRQELRDAYAAIALVHSLGYAAPAGLVAAASGVHVHELVRAHASDQAFAELVALVGETMKTRQRALSVMFVEDVLGASDLYDLSSSLATSIAPYVTPATISQRTRHARIAGQLMDERNLRRWVGESRVEPWYADQAENHGWNARFWEQRALAASRADAWDRAESYAERAVSILADPFTLNTLGTTLLRKATAGTAFDPEARLEFYRRAVGALEESREKGRERFMHPYVTFFEYTLRLAAASRGTKDGVPRVLVQSWNRWQQWARNSRVFSDEALSAQLDGYVTQWLMLAT